MLGFGPNYRVSQCICRDDDTAALAVGQCYRLARGYRVGYCLADFVHALVGAELNGPFNVADTEFDVHEFPHFFDLGQSC